MRLSRRASWLLIAFAVWSWIIWVTLVKNINNDPRSWHGNSPTGFLMVHVVLAIISLVMGTAIGWLGWKGLRGAKNVTPEGANSAGAAEIGATEENAEKRPQESGSAAR